MTEEKNTPKVRLAGLFREERNGEKGFRLSGSADRERVEIRPVVKQETEEHPDHEIFLIKRIQRGEGEKTPQEVCAGVLWTGKTRNGEDYLSGTFMMARGLVFRNHHRQGPDEPEFILYATSRQWSKPASTQEVPAETADGPMPF